MLTIDFAVFFTKFSNDVTKSHILFLPDSTFLPPAHFKIPEMTSVISVEQDLEAIKEKGQDYHNN